MSSHKSGKTDSNHDSSQIMSQQFCQRWLKTDTTFFSKNWTSVDIRSAADFLSVETLSKCNTAPVVDVESATILT